MCVFLLSVSQTFGAEKSWKSVADEMKGILEDACSIYEGGDSEKAYERVNDAYFGHYEVDGFERNTQSRIGGSRAGNVEVQFSRVKTAIRSGKEKSEVRKEADTLISMLFEDAEKLDPPNMSWQELAEILEKEFGEAASMYQEGHLVRAEPNDFEPGRKGRSCFFNRRTFPADFKNGH